MSFSEYQNIVYPMAAMVLLTFIVLALLFRSRTKAVSEKQLSPEYFKVYVGAEEPDASKKLSRHFANLFEAPVLFYVVCIAALALKLSFGVFQLLAWVYVLFRMAHAFIHIGKNQLIYRIIAYFSGWGVLLAMWVILVLRVAGSV